MADSQPFERVRAVRAYERIVEQVEERVLLGRLTPGERLPSERDMMQQFGVGRSTVREALRVLESSGYVRSRPGDPHGPEVMPFSPAALQKSMTRLVRVGEIGLGDLVHFRMLVDGSANQLAAELATPEQLAEMEAAMEAMRAAVDVGYEEFSQADVAFHDAVARASRSMLLQVCSDVVRGAVLALIASRIAEAGDRRELMLRSTEHHAEVLDAVRSRDGARAARLARTTLHDYYVDYVPVAERPMLRALLARDGVPSGRYDQ